MTESLTADQLEALPEGAQVIDRYGDILTKEGGLWRSFETAPMTSAKVAKWLPRVLEEG